MKKFTIKIIFLYIAFILISFGSSIMIHVSYVGLEPWSAVHLGLSNFALSVGVWTSIIQIIFILFAFLLEKKPPGIGTILNTISIGPFIDFFLSLKLFPPIDNMVYAYFFFILGIFVSSFGIGLAILTDLGAGAKTHFYVVLHKKYKLSLSRAKSLMEIAGLLLAFVFGGPLFIGTIIFAFISGPIVQFSVSFYKNIASIK